MRNEAIATGVRIGAQAPHPIIVETPAWLDRAVACLSDREAFFPEDYSLRCRPAIEAAKAICATCPVREECLQWALPVPSLDGIWGGTTPLERRRLRNPR